MYGVRSRDPGLLVGGLSLLVLVLASGHGLAVPERSWLASRSRQQGQLVLPLVPSALGEVTLSKSSAGGAVFSGAPLWPVPGEPALPCHTVVVLLPPEADPRSVRVGITGEVLAAVPGTWDVEPAPPEFVADEPGKPLYPAGRVISRGRDVAIYSRNAFQPASVVSLATSAQLREYRLAEVTLFPYRYNPVTGELQRLVQAELVVTYSAEAGSLTAARSRGRPAERARALLAQQAINFEAMAPAYGSSGDAGPLGSAPGYVILTTSYIATNSTQLPGFVAAKEAQGFQVTVATESDWGGGSGDTAAENIRAWLRANYLAANVQYVLLIGNPDPVSGDVPMKVAAPDLAYEQDVCPTDHYYAELTGDWDLDNDGLYGEFADDYGPGGAERYAEVAVGRIPYYGVLSDLDSILAKVLTYESAPAEDTEWRKRAVLPVSVLDFPTAYIFGEAIKDLVLVPEGWAYHRVYWEDYGLVPPPESVPCNYDTVIAAWTEAPAGAVFWFSHGEYWYAVNVIPNYRLGSLDDSHPSFTYQGSCYTGRPENSDNLAYSLLRHGAIATVAATRTSYMNAASSYEYVANSLMDQGIGLEYAERLIRERMPAGDSLSDLRTRGPMAHYDEWKNCITFNLYGCPEVALYPAATPNPAGVFYVAPGGSDANDGSSWELAKASVQAAVNEARTGDSVWVAAGTYVGPVTLEKGVALYGGFAGTETQLEQRDWRAHVTVLDADQQGPVVTVWYCPSELARIDGFTIRNGRSSDDGGGIYCVGSYPTIINNTITSNAADYSGGGVAVVSSSPIITRNRVVGNAALEGGGIACRGFSELTLANNTITGNAASHNGGAVHVAGNTGVSVSIVGNVIADNNCYATGGGVYALGQWSSVSVVGNTIVGNASATGNAGAVWHQGLGGSGSLELVNNVICLNSTGVSSGEPHVIGHNCAWGNTGWNYDPAMTDPTGSEGNISQDPCLTDPSGDDYHLRPVSPCRDAGDDAVVGAGWLDMDGQSRVFGPSVDIGADEWTPTTTSIGLYAASSSTFYLRNYDSPGAANWVYRFGPSGANWTPLVGDWDADGDGTVGLYNPTAATFFLRNAHSAGAADITFRFGPAPNNWMPIAGDWDGDGHSTFGLYNAATGTLFLRNSNTPGPADLTFRFGPTGSAWLPIVGDWDGNGTETVGLYNPASGTFYLRNSNSAGVADLTFRFGPAASTWKPIAGDWNQDGIDTVGLYNPVSGTFYLRNDNAPGPANVTFRYGPAPSTWLPIAGDWDGM